MNRVLLTVVLTLLSLPVWAQQNVVEQAKHDLAAAGVRVQNVACSDFEIAKVVAGRIPGAGLLTKDCCGDENDPNRSHCLYNGVWYAHDIVAFPDGTLVDIAIDGGGQNGPNWDPAPPDPSVTSRYRSASSLGLFGFVPGAAPVPVPVPPPVVVPPPAPMPTLPSVDYTGLLTEILNSQRLLLELQQQTIVIAKDTNAHVVSMDRTITQTLGSVGVFLAKYVAPAIGGYLIAKQVAEPSAAPAK